MTTLDPETRAAIRAAYHAGTLAVQAVDPATGDVAIVPMTQVLRHHTPHKEMVRVTLGDGRSECCTEDHSLFRKEGPGVVPVAAGQLRAGMPLVTVKEGAITEVPITSRVFLPPEQYTYDLSVPGYENFVLTSGILAHNSYSIGGISLDLEKSSKYESLKQNAESMFDKAAEAKARTVKFVRGLQQPRFGMGVRSAFGPATGRGVLGPRAFM